MAPKKYAKVYHWPLFNEEGKTIGLTDEEVERGDRFWFLGVSRFPNENTTWVKNAHEQEAKFYNNKVLDADKLAVKGDIR